MSEAAAAQSRASLQERLERYYQAKTDPDARISAFTPISDGWETEVYAFELTLNQQTERLILRMYPGTDAAEKSTHEYNGIAALKASGYSVPAVYFHEMDAALLGKPFIIMQRIDGQPLGLVMREHPERFPELLARFAQLLVDLHRLDFTPFTLLDAGDPADWMTRKLQLGRRMFVEQLQQAWTVPVFEWLASRSATVHTAQLSVMHGDFHPWNILLTRDDQAYVIDWGNIEVGDYRYDLAWTLLLAAAHGSDQERDLVLSEYERLAGHLVEQIEYFEVVAALRRLIGFMISQESGAESAGMRPEAAAIMRGQKARFEKVYAILQRHTGLRLPEIERLLGSLG